MELGEYLERYMRFGILMCNGADCVRWLSRIAVRWAEVVLRNSYHVHEQCV